MPERLTSEDTSIVIGKSEHIGCNNQSSTNLSSVNSILMWYYAYSSRVYACSSVLIPQCIYNSAMLLDFRMPFFPISLPYNSP